MVYTERNTVEITTN